MRRDKCTHWWIIEPARRLTSRGRCQLCGAVKEDFENYPPPPPEGSWTSPGRKAVMGRYYAEKLTNPAQVEML